MIEMIGSALAVFTVIGLPLGLLGFLAMGWEGVKRASE